MYYSKMTIIQPWIYILLGTIKLKTFEVIDFAGLFWPSLAFLAFVASDKFFKQKLAFFGKNN